MMYKLLLFKAIPAPQGSLSALAVSDNGNFVATGSMFDGTVEIFIAYNLTVSKYDRIRRIILKIYKDYH